MADQQTPAKPRRRPHDAWPGLEVAIVGTGIAPKDIPLRQAVEILEAAAATLEVVIEERGAALAVPALTEVRKGSACYQLRTADVGLVGVLDELEKHVETRGQHASNDLRRALMRLHQAGRGVGAVRLSTFDATGERRKRRLFVAAPVTPEGLPFDEGDEIYGEVVGVTLGREYVIRLRLDDGGTRDFFADAKVAKTAGALFNEHVRATTTYRATAAGDRQDAAIEELEAWPDHGSPDDVLAHFDDVARRLRGRAIRASDWLRRREEHDDE